MDEDNKPDRLVQLTAQLEELEGTLREDRWTGDSFTDVYLLGKLNRG